MDDNSGALRELIELRIGALEQMVSREFTYVKEAMERVADQSAPIATVQGLLVRVDKLEKLFITEIKDINEALELLEDTQRQANNKIRILWWVGSIVTGALIAIITSLIKSWLGL